MKDWGSRESCSPSAPIILENGMKRPVRRPGNLGECQPRRAAQGSEHVHGRRPACRSPRPGLQAARHRTKRPRVAAAPPFGRPGCALNRPTWSPVNGSSARVCRVAQPLLAFAPRIPPCGVTAAGSSGRTGGGAIIICAMPDGQPVRGAGRRSGAFCKTPK